MNNNCEKNIEDIISVLNGILKQVENALCKADAVSAEVIKGELSDPDETRSIECFKETDRMLGELDEVRNALYEAAEHIHKALPAIHSMKWDIENRITGAASCYTSGAEHRKDGNL